ncbi:unnamed protein product [Moneuplotes crassus]|uniref:Uncharacterized protein n=1 Tax=Euplotes crassus TaxID=5936 RepID=A0AAD2D8N1_EUPCR|nr:unnamed protein product [Moneuplotes crassus]
MGCHTEASKNKSSCAQGFALDYSDAKLVMTLSLQMIHGRSRCTKDFRGCSSALLCYSLKFA